MIAAGKVQGREGRSRDAVRSAQARGFGVPWTRDGTLTALEKPPPFEVDETKIEVPTLRPSTVSRTALVNRLRALDCGSPSCSVVAAAG